MSKLIDISGQSFGKLSVVGRAESQGLGHDTAWLCRCECGNNVIIKKTPLKNGKKKDCGCGSRQRRGDQNAIGLLGQRFGSVIVIGRSPKYSFHGMALWECQCDCGDIVELNGKQLRFGIRTDCGCITYKRKLSEEQMNFVLGTLLGDGCLSCLRGKTGNLRFNHSYKQMAFVMWKHRILSNISTPVQQIVNKGFGDYSACFTTSGLLQLGDLYQIIYPNCVKTVSQDWLSKINHPLSLAVWYMDDGSMNVKNGSTSFHTEGFPKDQVEILCEWLRSKWEIPCRITEYRTYCRIDLTADGRRRLHSLIKPYIIPEMEYKINHKFDDLSRKNPLCKPIKRIDNNEEIHYCSIKEAASEGFNRAGLWNALKNRKSYRGYRWEWQNNITKKVGP